MSYVLDETRIYRSSEGIEHRNDEYDETGFAFLAQMQRDHFWYRGRHKFLLRSVLSQPRASRPNVIDLGGGTGGWVHYLKERSGIDFSELALGDSSDIALSKAREILPASTDVYQADLMNLQWQDRWEMAFLLDVIEHCPDDREVLAQVFRALRPGGTLFVTTPALQYFWSYNDDLVHHLRRYSVDDYQKLAQATGFQLLDARYFMFFLSPLYFFSRMIGTKSLDKQRSEELFKREHSMPNRIINNLLAGIFLAETGIGHRIHFPWGTSALGVFRKPVK